MENTNNKCLYGWLFTFNYHNGLWSAFSREDYAAYWNGSKSVKPVYSHSDIDEVIELVKNDLSKKTK